MGSEANMDSPSASNTPEEIYYRQVPSAWVTVEGTVAMAAFRPTSKDERKLSLASSEELSPEVAHENHLARGANSSGVVGISDPEVVSTFSNLEPRAEVPTLLLRTIVRDDDPFDGHAHIDFSELTKRECSTVAAVLSDASNERGWLFRPQRTGING